MTDPSPVTTVLAGFPDPIAPFPAWSLFLLFILLLAQGLFLFLDGRRNGIRLYWVWALWSLTTCPLPSVLYWFLVRRKHIRKHLPPPSAQ